MSRPVRKTSARGDAYAAAGVDIDAGNAAVRRLKRHVRGTRTPEVLTDVGGFGGLFRLPAGLRHPVLVASTDGVGTKLLVAKAMGRYDTVGQDLVNHCVNDILVQGAKPLFFLDYFATGRLDPRLVEQIVKGLAQACRENGCALLGGETAEMPGLYQGDDFDLAGTVVGVVERREVVDGERIRPGDAVLGLPSTGLHTNGYSLARHICFERLGLRPGSRVPGLRRSLGEELLRVHRSYLRPVQRLRRTVEVKGMAHITGGGFIDNIPRILPEGCQAVIRKGTWPVPPIFTYLAEKGRLDEATCYRTFNMGIGMVLMVPNEQVAKALKLLKLAREKAYVIGEIEKGKREVRLVGDVK